MSQRSPFLPLIKKFGWVAALLVILLVVALIFLFRPKNSALPDSSSNNNTEYVPTSTAAFDGSLRVTVREPGIYALPWPELARLGFADAPPAQLRLFNLGEPQPLWFSGTGDDLTLYFYGHLLETPYTAENVYILTTHPAPLSAELTLTAAQPPVFNSSHQHFEENLIYLPRAEAEHTWYWKNFTAPKTEPIEFTLDHFAPGEATLRVALFANTEATNLDPDHHLRLLLNDTLLVDETWDGRGGHLIEQTFPTETLRAGKNTLTLELPGDTGAIVETLLLDWIELTYPNPLIAENARVGFRGTGEVLTLTGFDTPPFLFDLALAGDGSPVEITPSDSLQIPTISDHFYQAVGPTGFLTPLAFSPAQLTPALRTAQADYLAIGPPDLLEALQPLLDHRTAQGLTTLAVPVYAIYDQFGGGLAHPDAIRKFLQYAAQTWATPPRYVVLVGDSTYDPRGYQTSPQLNRVPTFFRFTFFGGETASDVAFAQLDDDHYPDLIVGRIPARTADQVAILVQKTLAYEQNPPSVGQRILAIADGQEASFATDAETFLGNFPTTYTPVLLTPPKGDTAAAGQITDKLNEGVLFMSYFGHGSITMLGKDRIFSVEDGLALENGAQLPIMINITCLAGLFTHPEVDSLTEVMLWNPNGGAVAALSATSLTVPSDQAFLTQAFVDALAQNPDATLGELFLTAQRLLPIESEGVREVMDTFLLFGDPALNLP
ncbi:MAG: hypothetical protein HUU38_01290 [Anaerolineales bacterium]|nr:hypothetical protein [Anaerolineales bacterium]